MPRAEIDEPITLERYNDNWPLQYGREVTRLKSFMAKYEPEFEHFGSTAVPGSLSKPIIDILVGVSEIPPSAAFVQQLVSNGYEYLGEAGVPGRHYFRTRGIFNFNLAVVNKRSNLWSDNLAIRDYLRVHPEDVGRYAALKESALESGVRTLLTYSIEKSEFMRELLAKARARKQSPKFTE